MIHDFVTKVDGLRASGHNFYLDPVRWRSSRVAFNLSWDYVPFTAANRKKIPTKRGVYAFIIRHANNHFPNHGYVMYVGITGVKGTTRTLYDRYGDYLSDRKRQKRPKIHYLVTKWPDDLTFAWAEVDPVVNLAKLELDLNDALMPPMVVQDFTAEVRQLKRALT